MKRRTVEQQYHHHSNNNNRYSHEVHTLLQSIRLNPLLIHLQIIISHLDSTLMYLYQCISIIIIPPPITDIPPTLLITSHIPDISIRVPLKTECIIHLVVCIRHMLSTNTGYPLRTILIPESLQ